MPGTATFEAEATNVSPHGLWLLLGGEEVYLSFVDFPWSEKRVSNSCRRYSVQLRIISIGRSWISIFPWSRSAILQLFHSCHAQRPNGAFDRTHRSALFFLGRRSWRRTGQLER